MFIGNAIKDVAEKEPYVPFAIWEILWNNGGVQFICLQIRYSNKNVKYSL